MPRGEERSIQSVSPPLFFLTLLFLLLLLLRRRRLRSFLLRESPFFLPAFLFRTTSSIMVTFSFENPFGRCDDSSPSSPSPLDPTSILLLAILLPIAILIVVALVVLLAVKPIRLRVFPYRDRKHSVQLRRPRQEN